MCMRDSRLLHALEPSVNGVDLDGAFIRSLFQALLGIGNEKTRKTAAAAAAASTGRSVTSHRGGTISTNRSDGDRSDGVPPLPAATTPPSGRSGAAKDHCPGPHSNKIAKDNHTEFDDWKKRTDNLAAAVLAAARVYRGPSSPPAPPVSLVL